MEFYSPEQHKHKHKQQIVFKRTFDDDLEMQSSHETTKEKIAKDIEKTRVYHAEFREALLFYKSNKDYIRDYWRIQKIIDSIPRRIEKKMKYYNYNRYDDGYKKLRSRYGKMILKLQKKCAIKYNLVSLHLRGGDMTSLDTNKEYSSAFETFHQKNNQRRLKAVSRLLNYIDKKGYNYKEFENKHFNIEDRAYYARKRLGLLVQIEKAYEMNMTIRFGKCLRNIPVYDPLENNSNLRIISEVSFNIPYYQR